MTHHPRKLYGQRQATCRHGVVVCSRCVVITDAARRMSDHVNLRVTCTPYDQLVRSWLAIKLADGSSDSTLYDSRQDAINHQLHETMCAYLCLRRCVGGLNARDAQIFLNMHRHIYDSGGSLSHITEDMIMSQYGYDVLLGRRDPYA